MASCGRLLIGLLAVQQKLREADCQSAAGCQPAPLPQNDSRSENWTTLGPPPTKPAVVPTAVATALPTVDVILPKLALLWLLTGLEKFV